MNVFETIATAITGKPKPSELPPGAAYVCERGMPAIKTELAGDFQTWLEMEASIAKLHHEQNHILTPQHAEQLYNRQVAEHAEHAAAGNALTGIERGRSREAWLADVEARLFASRQASQQLIAQATPFRKRVASVLINTLNEACAEMMLAESKVVSRFGLTYYQESPSLTQLRSLDKYLTNRGILTVLKLAAQ